MSVPLFAVFPVSNCQRCDIHILLRPSSFGIVGLTYNTNISTTVQGSQTGSLVNLIPILFTNALRLVDNLNTPLSLISSQLPVTIVTVNGILTGTQGTVNRGVISLTLQLANLSNSIANQQISPPSGMQFNCTYCQSVSASVLGISTQVNNTAGAAMTTFANTINTVQSAFVSVANDIASQTNSAATQLLSARSQVVSAQSNVDDVIAKSKTYDSQR